MHRPFIQQGHIGTDRHCEGEGGGGGGGENRSIIKRQNFNISWVENLRAVIPRTGGQESTFHSVSPRGCGTLV